MATALTNVSFDGSPVEFRMESPLLACFDPLALDMLRDLLSPDAPLDGLLERVNADYPAMACYTVPDFKPGVYALEPSDIKKFGDEDDDFDYNEGEPEPSDKVPDFLFAAVDSGTLIFADFAYLPNLATLLSWEQYDRSLGDDTVLPKIVDALGGPYFAVIISDCRLGIQFDGDGIYMISPAAVRWVRG
jgi:hypothetical protein